MVLLPHWGCAGFNRTYRRTDVPPALADLPDLETGKADLAFCLERLGAPAFVQRIHGEDQTVLTWTWDVQDAWGLFLSIPTGTKYSPSFNWSDIENQPQFVRLFFDRNWTLVKVAQG
ncbi:MAG: hypothetical protein O3A95_10730 [Planctomycetota bacterium]|nr:hypothetical protein [Planctomycetota bacterium]MDA1114757.1 hypothetical protein [Planctomycetota bacterium]